MTNEFVPQIVPQFGVHGVHSFFVPHFGVHILPGWIQYLKFISKSTIIHLQQAFYGV